MTHRVALSLAASTLALIFVGGLVTSTQSGLAVPDWPLSYGRLLPPMTGAVLFEHGHRLLAAAVGLLTIVVGALFQWKEPRPWLRRAAWAALGLVVLQGAFGGLTVLFKLKVPALSIVHACIAQAFFCLTVSLATWSSPAWSGLAARPAEAAGETPLHRVALFLFGFLFLQLVLGAAIRHTGRGVLAHALNPAVVLALIGVLVSRTPTGSPLLDRAAWAMAGVYFLQMVLGVLTYFLVSPGPMLAWPRAPGVAVVTSHVTTGAALLGLSVAAALLADRTRPDGGVRRFAADYLALTKPGISVMTALTALAGFALGAGGRLEGLPLFHTAVGTLAASGGAGALNMWRERDADAQMRRTENRPLPSRRLPPGEALLFGGVLAASGAAYLAFFVNALTAVLAAATLAVYVFLYTPLKTRSPLNTAVGAVAGALPPVLGWAAATGGLSAGALGLFAILFFWQFPHFYALAWLYREDYARAGFHMLPVVEPDGDSTARKIVTHSFALLTASLVPAFFGMTGRVYPVIAFALGAAMAAAAGFFFVTRTRAAARGVFLGSVVYLPILLSSMVWDRP